MTPQEELVREVARGIAWNSRPYAGPDNPVTLSEWVDDNWEDYTDAAKAAIAIVVERQKKELALSELANIEGASADWLNGFRFAADRIRALAEEQA